MSVTADLRSRSASGRGEFADRHALTQVEKWLAIIREINQERLSANLFEADLDAWKQRFLTSPK
jgi:hypothetical protein